MTVYLLHVWYREFDKVLNVFLYDDLEKALRMGAEFDADVLEDGDVRTVCTVVEGVVA